MADYLKQTGHIQLIIGPMFAGKTTELIRRIKRYNVAQKRVLFIKYIKDTRYSVENMSTHDHQTVLAKPCSLLSEVADLIANVDVIGIDEGQFYADLVPFCESAANNGKVVIVAALDGTFQRLPFGSVLDLIPKAESVTKLSSVCMICFRDASFSKRIAGGSDVEEIGGADKYIAVCRECYNNPKVNSSPLKVSKSPAKKDVVF
eukprot:GEZU01016071.1.p1 GENE.GEZU01016071.1~~GEZU01016071.1.p1  ORF type:complete len:233 (-),score=50.43 GEZU01016071.1:284-895(-)